MVKRFVTIDARRVLSLELVPSCPHCSPLHISSLYNIIPNTCNQDQAFLVANMSTSNAPIIPKRERSPTPPLTSTLQPRTSGVKLIAPLPKACRRSSPNYFQARRDWVREEIQALNALGLTVKNKFLRSVLRSSEFRVSVYRICLCRRSHIPLFLYFLLCVWDIEMMGYHLSGEVCT